MKLDYAAIGFMGAGLVLALVITEKCICLLLDWCFAW